MTACVGGWRFYLRWVPYRTVRTVSWRLQNRQGRMHAAPAYAHRLLGARAQGSRRPSFNVQTEERRSWTMVGTGALLRTFCWLVNQCSFAAMHAPAGGGHYIVASA